MLRPKNLLQTQIVAIRLDKKLERSSYGFSTSDDLFVGLPSSGLKEKWVQFTVEPDGPAAIAPVGHVGPWNGGGWNNKHDDKYWVGRKRPQAESGHDLKGNKTNRAGFVISSELWKKLGLGNKRKTLIRWMFVATPRAKQVIVVQDANRLKFKML